MMFCAFVLSTSSFSQDFHKHSSFYLTTMVRRTKCKRIYLVFLFILGFGGFLVSVKQCFLGMLGDFDLDAYTETTYRYISVTLLIIYIIVVTILLLNLLVAMMGDTYGNIIEGATQVWLVDRTPRRFSFELFIFVFESIGI